jgi:hypothetical protein
MSDEEFLRCSTAYNQYMEKRKARKKRLQTERAAAASAAPAIKQEDGTRAVKQEETAAVVTPMKERPRNTYDQVIGPALTLSLLIDRSLDRSKRIQDFQAFVNGMINDIKASNKPAKIIKKVDYSYDKADSGASETEQIGY